MNNKTTISHEFNPVEERISRDARQRLSATVDWPANLIEKYQDKLDVDVTKPALQFEPHLHGRLKVGCQGNWIATLIPKFLDDGFEWSMGDNAVELRILSDGEVEIYAHGSYAEIKMMLEIYQKTGNWLLAKDFVAH